MPSEDEILHSQYEQVEAAMYRLLIIEHYPFTMQSNKIQNFPSCYQTQLKFFFYTTLLRTYSVYFCT